MRSFWLLLLAAITVQLGTASGSPIIPGLANKHTLTEPQVGELLMGELRCAACHTRKDSTPAPERSAPDLTEVGARVAPEFLRKFIASPSAAHAGTTMPDLLAAESAEQRDKIAEAISHYLISQSTRRFEPQSAAKPESAVGKALFHSVGCVVCHSPRDEKGKDIQRAGAIDLGHLPAKYSHTSLSDFLFQPLRVRPSGRMPDMKLTRVEARAIADFLLGKADTKSVAIKPQANLIALGKQHVERLNCAACHKLGEVQAAKPIGQLEEAALSSGCLSNTPSKAPHFNLTAEQTKSIRSALSKKGKPVSDKDRLAAKLTAFNCIGCHVRDDYGGVSTDLMEHFTSSEKELGDEARIPPPLTFVGAKLQPVTMKKVLFDGDGVRYYMATRMPQFGEPNLHDLPELFARIDAQKNRHEFALPKSEGGNQQERDREKEMRAAGRELVGDKGLSCIACHSFKGKMTSKQGIDLLTFSQRLQPSWFYSFVRDPNSFRPRTVMPTAWPDGVALHDNILKGDTDRQIEAIWYYLSLGTSAQDPVGIRRTDALLQVTDATRTYRGRSSVAGFRGIAVGFPDKLNYAFNAETGALSALWQGDFIRVNRGGQGSGGFNPAAKFVQLPKDLSLYELPDEKTAWPVLPVMTKEVPANPDPLYPKNLGYQFKGYYMDDASIPTFMYRKGDIEIEDRSSTQVVDKRNRLVRTLAFNSPKARILWFRALTGKVEAKSRTEFKTADLRMIIPKVATLLRTTEADPKSPELLLKFEIPKGKSTQTLTYEILP